MNTLPRCQANTPGGLGGASGLRSCDFSSETALGGSSSQDTGDPVPRPAASLGNKGCWPSGFWLTPRVSSALRGHAYGLAVTRACPPAGGDTRPQDARRTASVHDHTTLLQTMLTFEECHGGTQAGSKLFGELWDPLEQRAPRRWRGEALACRSDVCAAGAAAFCPGEGPGPPMSHSPVT